MTGIRFKSQERTQFDQALMKTQDTRFFRRLLALRWLSKGHSVTEVSELLNISRKTVHEWIKIWKKYRSVSALRDDPREGRPPIITARIDAHLRKALRHRPRDYGLKTLNWTVPALIRFVCEKEHVKLSATTIRRRLHKLNFEWKRPRYLLDRDRDYEKKKSDSPKNQGIAGGLGCPL